MGMQMCRRPNKGSQIVSNIRYENKDKWTTGFSLLLVLPLPCCLLLTHFLLLFSCTFCLHAIVSGKWNCECVVLSKCIHYSFTRQNKARPKKFPAPKIWWNARQQIQPPLPMPTPLRGYTRRRLHWASERASERHTHEPKSTSYDVHVLKVDEVVDFDFSFLLPSPPYVHSVRQLNAFH